MVGGSFDGGPVERNDAPASTAHAQVEYFSSWRAPHLVGWLNVHTAGMHAGVKAAILSKCHGARDAGAGNAMRREMSRVDAAIKRTSLHSRA